MSFLLNVVFQSAQLGVTIANSIVNGTQSVRDTIYISQQRLMAQASDVATKYCLECVCVFGYWR